MYTDDFKIISELTPEVISNLIIHPTVSSLRRAIGSHLFHRQVGNKKIPTLFYIKDNDNPELNDWSIHALVMDLVRFTLYNINPNEETPDSGDDDPVDYPKSTFSIVKSDLYTVRCKDCECNGSVCRSAIITGSIPWDEQSQTNYLEFEVSFDNKMIGRYSPTFSAENQNVFEYNQTQYKLNGRLNISEFNQNSYFDIIWNDATDVPLYQEEFGIELNNCYLIQPE